jgi:protein phosphatase inhibitor 2
MSVAHGPSVPIRSASTSKPKGILKNAPPTSGTAAQHLQWDEENLALTELQKDSQMKITEPKTPYVRYNAELDEVEGEIPAFYLGSSCAPSPPPASPSPIEPSPPRRPSFSTGKRPGRSSSGSSNRSASFNIPSEIQQGEVEEESSDDEPMTPEAAAKHEAFLKARGRHYSNEAEAMKVRKCTFSCTFIRVHAFLCFVR